MEEKIRGLLVGFCIALIVFGICARFVNLDRKLYTNDEATASLHVAGRTIAEYAADVFDGRIRTVEQLLAYQQAGPASTAARVIGSLASEDPQHPPLFYLAERGWTELFGSSVTARRALSAWFGALAIGATAWLAWELFGSAAAALASAALLAISPFHVLYAQQVREYALWTLAVATAGALLLRALRERTPRLWAAYALALALGLYADVLFLLTIAAHAVYVFAFASGPGGRKAALAYGAATAAALAAFAPWIEPLWRGARSGALTNNSFLGTSLPLKVFALKWLFNAGAVFFDLDFRWHAAAFLLLPILGFALAALVALVRVAPARVWAFVLTAGAIPAVALILPDLVRHESRSTSARYLVPVWLALELAVGWYVARLVTVDGARRAAGVAAALVLAGAGVASCAVASRASAWWGDFSVASLVPVARAIAADPGALVAYRATWTLAGAPGERWDFAVVQLADVLPARVRFRQLPKNAAAGAVVAAGTTYVLDPTSALVAELATTKHPLIAIVNGALSGQDTVAALQRETQRARAAAGIVDFEASLWRPRSPT